MTDLTLQRLQDYGLIDWGVLFQGFLSLPGSNLRIKASEISDFAATQLETIDEEDETYSIVVELASANYCSDGEITSLLRKICAKKKIDLETALRKWRVVLLIETLDNLQGNPLYALIDLTTFWTNWNNPADSPHTIQGVGNEIAPNEYYSLENLNKITERHRLWISQELSKLGAV